MEMSAHVNTVEAAESDDRELTTREIDFSKKLGRMLADHYSGYMWSVEVNLRGKYKGAKISLPRLTGPAVGYVIPGHLLTSENSAKAHVIRAGGEILERFRIPRSSINLGMAKFIDAKERLPFGLRKGQEMPV